MIVGSDISTGGPESSRHNDETPALRVARIGVLLLSILAVTSSCVPSDAGDPDRRRIGVLLNDDGTYEVLVHLCEGERLERVRAVPGEAPEGRESVFWRGSPAVQDASGLLGTSAAVRSQRIETGSGSLRAPELPPIVAVEALVDDVGWLPLSVDSEAMEVGRVHVVAAAFGDDRFVSRATFERVNADACASNR